MTVETIIGYFAVGAGIGTGTVIFVRWLTRLQVDKFDPHRGTPEQETAALRLFSEATSAKRLLLARFIQETNYATETRDRRIAMGSDPKVEQSLWSAAWDTARKQMDDDDAILEAERARRLHAIRPDWGSP